MYERERLYLIIQFFIISVQHQQPEGQLQMHPKRKQNKDVTK